MAPSARIGRPAQTDLTLDLSALTGVTLYEPEELVLSARAGTPIAEIEALVASKGQQLAFEPMDYGPLLGGAAGCGTIGGVLAANLSGPRRIKAGAARDHFLGLTAVSGRGETFKSGGRVVKNVTGYDLCKLHGRLLGHAGGDDRGHDQDAAAAGDRGDGRDDRPRRRGRREGDDRRHGLVVRCVRRRASAGGGGRRNPACRSDSAGPRAHAAAARRRGAVGRAPAGGVDRDRQAVRRGRADRRGVVVAAVARDPRRRCRSRPAGPAPKRRSGASRPHRRAVPSWPRMVAAGTGATLPLRLGRRAHLARRSTARATTPAQPSYAAPWRLAAATPRWSARRRRCGPRSTCSSRRMPLLAALTKRVKDGFDPKGVLNPGRMWAGV